MVPDTTLLLVGSLRLLYLTDDFPTVSNPVLTDEGSFYNREDLPIS